MRDLVHPGITEAGNPDCSPLPGALEVKLITTIRKGDHRQGSELPKTETQHK